MFERFTDRARRVIVLADEESRLLDHGYIGTEHLLLGLLSLGDGRAFDVLTSCDLDLNVARAEVEEIVGRGAPCVRGHVPFTPRAKKVLELSLREAFQLGQFEVFTEHILLGLIREGEGVACQALVKCGFDLAQLRRRTIELATNQHETTSVRPSVIDLGVYYAYDTRPFIAGRSRYRKLSDAMFLECSALEAVLERMDGKNGVHILPEELREISEFKRQLDNLGVPAENPLAHLLSGMIGCSSPV
jgi:ATP-dependent Clp protease ATP-binding subunit ClpA